MKTTEEETKQPLSSSTPKGEDAIAQDKPASAEKEEVAKTEETSASAETTADKPAVEKVKEEDQKKDKGTEASAKATGDKPTEKEEAKGEDTKAKGGEDKKDQDTDTSAEAMADKKATSDKPAEKEEAKEEEDAPKKKRKSERQEEAAEFEDEGELTEVMVEQKAEMVLKIQNGHVSISTGKVELPAFGSGDTITIHYKIREGNKERIQQFQGVVIQRRGSHTTETCTIRKVSGGIGVERIFPLHSPFIDKIVVHKRGKVRRARIFYLRKLKGKKARIQEKKN